MAIAALDRYVSLVKHVEVEEIQLIAGACLFIANKCEVNNAIYTHFNGRNCGR